MDAYSLNGYLYGADCKVGTKVIASLSEYDGELSANVYNYDRELEIGLLLAVFFGLMWLVGGKKGFNSIIALIFTFCVVIMLYIPMMYIGISPFASATVSVVIITFVTFVLIADFQMKSIGAMLGTIFAVISGRCSLISCREVETDIATSMTAPSDAIKIPEKSIPPISSLEFCPT